MKRFLLLFSAAALMAGSAVYAAQPLLTPAELNAVRSEPAVRIIDIRPPQDYAANHIPGALSAPYGQWRGPADNPGLLPPVEKLADLVRKLGVDQNIHAVVVSSGSDATDFGSSARVYWTLKYLGLSELSILNGGVKAWADAGLPQDQAVPTVAASTYTPVLNRSLIATQEQVLAQIDNPKVHLVDARPSNFFRGEVKAPTAKIPGTIHNALNLEHSKWFKPGTSIFVSPDEAKTIASQSLPEPADETISFCNTGHWAATDWFALSEVVGQKNVMLYPASLADWTQSSEALPMDNVPSRGQQIWKSLKDLAG
ncbi:Sulfurtransferase [Bordetella tumbae]|uniref:sulfurtransferase n=1 Tax=Bordetella tumbae TaxID=1649139 RepID=UPI0039EEC672